MFYLQKLFCNSVLKSLAGLEHGSLGSGNLDGFLGLGVAAHASLAALQLEGAKANQLHLVALCDGFLDGIDDGGESLFCILLGQAGLCGDLGYEFSLVHNQ